MRKNVFGIVGSFNALHERGGEWLGRWRISAAVVDDAVPEMGEEFGWLDLFQIGDGARGQDGEGARNSEMSK